MPFNDIVSGGIQSEYVATSEQPDTLYDLVGHYLNLMFNTCAYSTHFEFIAASHLFNIHINLTYAGTSYPSSPREPNSCNVLYDSVAQHYSSSVAGERYYCCIPGTQHRCTRRCLCPCATPLATSRRGTL